MTLLFAEDEYYTRKGILDSVNWDELGISRVLTGTDGRSGMQQLAIRPDILLTDIRMPFYTGLELASRAKENDPYIEVIFLSSYSDKEYLFRAISLSTVAYIEKPVDLAELSSGILQAVDRRKESALLYKILLKQKIAHELHTLPNPENKAYSHATRSTLKHLSENYRDPDLSLEVIAGYVNISPAYLSSLFKKDTGRNLKRVIIEVRMEQAQRLLTDTNLTIARISESIGYRSANYFAKLFQKETGLTPHQYRERGE